MYVCVCKRLVQCKEKRRRVLEESTRLRYPPYVPFSIDKQVAATERKVE